MRDFGKVNFSSHTSEQKIGIESQLLIRSRLLYLATARGYHTAAGIDVTPTGLDAAPARIEDIATRIILATAFFFTCRCVLVCTHKDHLL
jgi:hypothetical protein